MIRRVLFLIPLCLLLLGSAYAQQTSGKDYFATLKVDQLLYESPEGDISPVLLRKGDYVRLVPVINTDDWYGIYTIDKENGNKATFRGFLKSPYVESTASQGSAFNTSYETTPEAPTRTRYVRQHANIREKPSLDASIVAEVDEGTQIGVVDYVQGWAMVHIPEAALLTDEGRANDSSIGFISGELLGREPPEKPVVSLPVANEEHELHSADSLSATL